jgi:hypothetical membrane protein
MIKMMTSNILINFAIFYFIAIIIVAHYFAPDIYHWTTNTISDLAAQNYNYAWIMRIGFIGFGLLLNLGILLKIYKTKSVNPADVLIMIYGLAILCSGVFSTMPFDSSVIYSTMADKLHSIFAQIAGIALSIGIIIYLILSPGNKNFIHLLFFILIIGISALFGLSKNEIINIDYGILQRLLYGVSFIWLFLTYNTFST